VDHIYRIALAVPEAAVDIFAEALEPLVASVAWRAQEGKIKAEVLGFTAAPPDAVAIRAAMRRCAAAAGTAEPDMSITMEAVRDWAADNPNQFPPITAGRFFVYGSEYSGPLPAAKIALRIPAGAAFGSGDHGTTKGCLLALDQIRRPVPGPVLDMGCGSGILACAAARRWRRPVLAVDIDPVAVMVAQENIEANRLGHLARGICAPGYRHRNIGRAQYSVITANILARPLARMAGDLARHLAPGGTAILSGLLVQDASWVLGAHRRFGLIKAGQIAINGWATLVLRKKADAKPEKFP
jgi:ribosomal protein L11 methyltransferase